MATSTQGEARALVAFGYQAEKLQRFYGRLLGPVEDEYWMGPGGGDFVESFGQQLCGLASSGAGLQASGLGDGAQHIGQSHGLPDQVEGAEIAGVKLCHQEAAQRRLAHARRGGHQQVQAALQGGR